MAWLKHGRPVLGGRSSSLDLVLAREVHDDEYGPAPSSPNPLPVDWWFDREDMRAPQSPNPRPVEWWYIHEEGVWTNGIEKVVGNNMEDDMPNMHRQAMHF